MRNILIHRRFHRGMGSVLLSLFFMLGIGLSATAQEKTVSLQMKQVSLVQVFDRLEQMTGIHFLYNAEVIKAKGVVDINVTNKTLDELLKIILVPKGLTHSINGKQVVIRPGAAEPLQEFMITGTVTDEKGNPLPGATVRIDSTSVGTATDVAGRFTLRFMKKTGNLKFSFVGYKMKTMKFESGKPVTVKLDPDAADLDQVTVIAYGSRKKREIVGAISSVTAEDIKEVPAPSLETLLQGRVAGLGVFQQSGSPGGGGNSVAVRGYNSLLDDETGYKSSGAPLYVVDGVPVSSFTSPITGTNTMAEIDPSTIESIQVLKDAASAAIYGSRAANGVILITTKKGRAGRGKFSANFSYTGSILPETPVQTGGKGERLYHMAMMKATKSAYYDAETGEYRYPSNKYEAALNGANYDSFWNPGKGIQSGGVMKIIQDSLNPFFNNSTNWYKHVFRPGRIYNANIQTSGGTETINYMIGAGFYKEEGIMPGSNFVRGNILTNLSVIPVKNLTIDSRLYLAYTDRSRGSGSVAGLAESFTVDPKSTSTLMPGSGEMFDIMLKKLNGKIEDNTSYRLRANLKLGYEVIKGLNISTSLALDFTQANLNTFSPTYLDPTYHEAKSEGEIGRDLTLLNDNLVSYNFSLKEVHNFDLLLGLSNERSMTWSIGGYGLGSPSNSIHYVSGSFPQEIYNSVSGVYRAMQSYKSDFSETLMLSYFGRIAYNYDTKYLIEATFRRDGSSVFGSDNRWGTFPSVAAGWAFSQENFMRWAWWLSYGKLRASWGRTGSQFGIPYLAQGLMNAGSIFDGVQGMMPEGITNHKLKWEESDQYDFGLDIDMFEYRLGLTIDYYYKYTRDLIYKTVLPGDMYGQNGVQWQNAMEVSNEGLEVDIKYDVFRDGPFTWRARFNLAKNWNRFEKSYLGVDTDGMIIGKPLNGIYLYKDGGLIQSEGDIPVVYGEDGKKHVLSPGGDEEYFYTLGMRKPVDINGDGQISEDDIYYAGSSLPTLYGGFASELKWKNFDLNFLIMYELGRKMINAEKWQTLASPDAGSNPLFSDVKLEDFWQKPGDDTEYPAPGIYPQDALQYMGAFDSNIENVSYMKVKQLTLGYNVPSKYVKKLHLDNIRVFVTGENLLTLDNYSGLDPEVVNVHTGVDLGRTYPLARKWTVGLTVNF